MTSLTPVVDIKPGIYPGMSYEDYDAIDAANQTALKACLFKSPAHYRGEHDFPKPPSDELIFGQAFDTLLLEGREVLEQRFAIAGPEVLTKSGARAGKAWEAFKEEAEGAGKQIIKAEGNHHSLEVAERMVASISEHPAAKDLLGRGGDTQCVIVWVDEPTRLVCKMRADRLVQDQWPSIPDVKTAANASPMAFSRAMENYGYDLQGAFYEYGAGQFLTNPNYVPIVIEKDPYAPGKHAVAVYPIGRGSIKRGQRLFREGLEIYRHCRETGQWPCYSDEPMELDVPKWALREYEQ